MKTELLIEGMTCASCAHHVEKSLLAVPGVSLAQVNLTTHKAHIEMSVNTQAADLILAIQNAGYDAAESQQRRLPEHEGRTVVLAAIFTLPLLATHILPSLSLDWRLQFALASLVQFFFGIRFYRSGFKAIRHAHANMDFLVSIGTLASFGLSTYLGLQPSHHL